MIPNIHLLLFYLIELPFRNLWSFELNLEKERRFEEKRGEKR